MACATSRVRFGTTVTPLPRRRPWKVAAEAVALDHLSGGRMILGVGIGDPAIRSWQESGTTDPRVLAEMLDEGAAGHRRAVVRRARSPPGQALPARRRPTDRAAAAAAEDPDLDRRQPVSSLPYAEESSAGTAPAPTKARPRRAPDPPRRRPRAESRTRQRLRRQGQRRRPAGVRRSRRDLVGPLDRPGPRADAEQILEPDRQALTCRPPDRRPRPDHQRNPRHHGSPIGAPGELRWTTARSAGRHGSHHRPIALAEVLGDLGSGRPAVCERRDLDPRASLGRSEARIADR